MLLKTMLGYTVVIKTPPVVDTVFTGLAILFLMISIFYQKTKIGTLVAYTLVSAALFGVGYVIGNNTLSITVLTCFSLQGKDFNKFIKLIYRLMIIVFIISLIWFGVEFLSGNEKIFIARSAYEEANRALLGFSHPNIASAVFFDLILMWIWLNYERLKKRHFAVLGALTFVIYLLTDTRTLVLNGIIAFFVIAYSKIGKKKVNKLKMAAMCIFPCLLLMMHLLCANYSKNIEIINILDEMMSTRIKLGAYAYEHWGITYFGQNLSNFAMRWDSTWGLNEHTFDNVYSFLLYNVGLVWAVCLSIILILFARKCDVKMRSFIFIWCIYGMTEVHGLNGFMMFPIFLLSQIGNLPKSGNKKRSV